MRYQELTNWFRRPTKQVLLGMDRSSTASGQWFCFVDEVQSGLNFSDFGCFVLVGCFVILGFSTSHSETPP